MFKTGRSLYNRFLMSFSAEDSVPLSVMESVCVPAGVPVDWTGLAG